MSIVDKSKVRVICSICGKKHWYSFDALCSSDILNVKLFKEKWTINPKNGRLEVCKNPDCVTEAAKQKEKQ